MKLTKRAPSSQGQQAGVNRRVFLKGSGIAAGGAAFLSLLPTAMIQKAEASEGKRHAYDDGEITKVRSVCSHCSVGCGVVAKIYSSLLKTLYSVSPERANGLKMPKVIILVFWLRVQSPARRVCEACFCLRGRGGSEGGKYANNHPL